MSLHPKYPVEICHMVSPSPFSWYGESEPSPVLWAKPPIFAALFKDVMAGGEIAPKEVPEIFNTDILYEFFPSPTFVLKSELSMCEGEIEWFNQTKSFS